MTEFRVNTFTAYHQLNAGQSATFTITFSECVTRFAVGDLTPTNAWPLQPAQDGGYNPSGRLR